MTAKRDCAGQSFESAARIEEAELITLPAKTVDELGGDLSSFGIG